MADVVQLPDRRDKVVGTLVGGRYKVLEPLARGGMGRIYIAEQQPSGRRVALKLLDIEGHSDEQNFSKRFALEASIVSRLTHPNTVTVYDCGTTDDDIQYIAMELLQGRTLRDAIRAEGRLSPERTVRFVKQICRSVREAHDLGVIHRDLKPANIFLVKREHEQETVKVLDFGLVKYFDRDWTQVTVPGGLVGSPNYMAPEQLRCGELDERTDIYALGVLMFEMLAGSPPFARDNPMTTMVAHLQEVPPLVSEVNPAAVVPAELENILQRCMAKRKDDRFADMAHLFEVLDQFDGSVETSVAQPSAGIEPLPAVSVRPPDTGSFAGIARGRKPGSVFAALSFVLLVGIGVGVVMIGQREKSEAEPEPLAQPEVPLLPARPAPAPELAQVEIPEGKVVVTLGSNPPGATVTVGDQAYGPTPLHIVLSGEHAVIGRAIEFHFSREGYRPQTVSRRIDSQKIVLKTVELVPRDDLPR